jgi:hypothetical protein
MTDIVELLRDYSPYEANHVVHEAADEIERLRSALGSGVTITNEFYFSLVSRAEAAEARVFDLEEAISVMRHNAANPDVGRQRLIELNDYIAKAWEIGTGLSAGAVQE